MKQKLTIIVCTIGLLCYHSLYAQDSKKYKEMAETVEKGIWETKDPIFESNTVPAEYKNESAVILAQKNTVATDSKKKTGFFGLPTKNYIDKKVWRTFRQKILINDQASLNEYSELNFAKIDSKSRGIMGGKNMAFTFMGIKLIKPDGTVQKIKIDESAVTLKETKDGKKNKIAIPNLAIGDIIDYYISSYSQNETGTATYYADLPELLTFVLTDDYPVLNYSISLVLDKKVAADYQCINGAPDFKITKTDDENTLELNTKNLIKIKDLIWASNSRQLPIIRLKYVFGNLYSGKFEVKKGEVRKSTNAPERIETSIQNLLAGRFLDIYKTDVSLAKMREGFDDAKKDLAKIRPAAVSNLDSLSAVAYYIGRLYSFYSDAFTLQDDFTDNDKGFPLYMQLLQALRMRSMFENALKIDCEFIDVAGRNSVTRANLFEEGDLSILLRINTPKPTYLYVGNMLYNYGEIPPSLEGEDGAYFSIKPKKALFGKVTDYVVEDEGKVKLPVFTKEDHIQNSLLTVSIDLNNQLLTVNRTTKAKGQLRRFFQASLLMSEDILKAQRAFLGLSTDLVAQYTDLGRAQRKSVDEFTAILKKARKDEKANFEKEIKNEFEVKPKELKSFRIVRDGLHHTNSEFEMQEEFTVDSWIKKAGNNFIVEVGKLAGDQFEIKADQRDRKLDIYMSHARTFNYRVEVIIPDGYSAEGIEKLNKKIENETGGFVSTAAVEGNKLIITTHKYYNNSVEKVQNWTKLTAFVDAAFEFNKEKILLKKK